MSRHNLFVNVCRGILVAGMVALAAPLGASAATLFSDDFQSYSIGDGPTSDARWDVNSNGQIAVNPVQSGGNTSTQALNFTATQGGGDLFSRVISLVTGQTYRINFDFLGTNLSSGGFAGVSATNTATHLWYYSTAPSVSGSDPVLVSDGEWRNYTYEFTAPVLGNVTDIRLMFEDFSGSSGDAYFDNVRLSAVPLPAALPLFAAGLAGFGALRLRKRKKAVAAGKV